MQTQVATQSCPPANGRHAVAWLATEKVRVRRPARASKPVAATPDRRDCRDPAHPDAQLLQTLVCGASRTPPSPDVGHILLKRFGSLQAVIAAPYDEIAALRVLPDSVIKQIGRVYAAAQRMTRAKFEGEPVDSGCPRFLDYLVTAMSHEAREQVRLFSIDAKQCLIAETITATGTLDHVQVYPREVMASALAQNAHAVIVAHNHPSGDPTPSAAELAMVATLLRGANALSVVLDDYIMVGDGACFSFRAHGLLGRAL